MEETLSDHDLLKRLESVGLVEGTDADAVEEEEKPPAEFLLIEPLHGGRVTGWRVRCPRHGPLAPALKDKNKASAQAVSHVTAFHGGNMEIRERKR